MDVPTRILIVSKNETLKRNIEEWFRNKIENKTIVLDYTNSREDAESLMAVNNYDKIFHNGIYIIDAIENLQVGSEVFQYGRTNNNLCNVIPNIHNKKVFSKIFSKKYLNLGVNIGGFLGSVMAILIGLVGFISFMFFVRADVNINMAHIEENTEEIKEVKRDVKDVRVELGVVGRDANDALLILQTVYGDKLKIKLPENDKK
ncbi:MAG: hypothetical protein ACW96U_00075 [Candidatus Heimdallarchaeaceae archaeon]|jgi:hypothetical protein